MSNFSPSPKITTDKLPENKPRPIKRDTLDESSIQTRIKCLEFAHRVSTDPNLVLRTAEMFETWVKRA